MPLICASYAGNDQWQLEGVQPGGIRSGGIYGLWSHVDQLVLLSIQTNPANSR